MLRRHIISNTKFIADWSHTIHEITTTPRNHTHLTHHAAWRTNRSRSSRETQCWLVVAVSPKKSQVGDQFKFHNSIKDESVAWGIGESIENLFA